MVAVPSQDAEARLQRLRIRRRGLARPDDLSPARHRVATVRKSQAEPWDQTGLPTATAFAVGAMTQVDPDATCEMVEAAESLAADVIGELKAMGKWCVVRLQGSAIANTHIQEHSDVDLLIVDDVFETSDLFTFRNLLGVGLANTGDASAERLLRLRRALDALLSVRCGQAADTSGAKAIRIAGGLLPCALDVVAAHWHHTAAYERSGQDVDRGVVLLDRRRRNPIETSPFQLASRIDRRDDAANGGLRRAIRLCKNLKADATESGASIDLSSYEITTLLYTVEPNALSQGRDHHLAALSGAEAWLRYLTDDPRAPRQFRTAEDGYRIVTPDRSALSRLADRLTTLCGEVAAELGVTASSRGLRGVGPLGLT